MKKYSLYWVFAVCLLMLSSCLGDGSTQITVGWQEAVYQMRPARGLVLKDGRLIYSQQINSLSADGGDCFLVQYGFDSASPELTGKDSLQVELLDNPISLPLWTAEKTVISDTILTDEQYISTVRPRTAYIKGRLFLWSEIREPESQVDSLVMSYNPDQLYTTEDGYRTYNLYLRAVRKSVVETDTVPATMVHTDAFDIEDFFNSAKAIEEQDNATEFTIAINYASGHNKDTTAVNWATPRLINFVFVTKVNSNGTTTNEWEQK